MECEDVDEVSWSLVVKLVVTPEQRICGQTVNCSGDETETAEVRVGEILEDLDDDLGRKRIQHDGQSIDEGFDDDSSCPQLPKC